MRHIMRKTREVWATAVMLGAVLVVLGVGGSGDLATAARPQPARFVDNGDGTITDTQTGLMWEMKTGADATANYNDPTDVDNVYTWTTNSPAPDGSLFTDFLAKMNCSVSGDGTCPVNGRYRDWRIPTIAELGSIVNTSVAGCGAGTPCIDLIFGPTAASRYWSSSSYAFDPAFAWGVFFDLWRHDRDSQERPLPRAGRAGRLVIDDLALRII